MKYIKKFPQQSDYEAFIGGGVDRPNVSYVVENDKCHFHATLSPYYMSLEDAISDVNSGTLFKTSTKNIDNAVCHIDNTTKDKPVITLLKETEFVNTIVINQPVVINFQYFEHTSLADCLFEINNDCEMSNLKLTLNLTNPVNNIGFAHVKNGNLSISNINCISHTYGVGVKDNTYGFFKVSENATFNTSSSNVHMYDTSGGCLSVIIVDSNATFKSNDCTFEITSQEGMSNVLQTSGICECENSAFLGYSNHCANAAGNDYGQTSRGIQAPAGSVTLINCELYGTHSGGTFKSALSINGGVYKGYSHGGIYLSNGAQETRLYNAEFNEVDLIGEGFYDDGIAGSNHAGMYIGGASNMSVYMNNCTIYGLQQPIVLRGTSNESNNHLYVSNTTINLDYTHYGVRNDGSNQISIGVGNNFNETNLKYQRNYEITDLTY